MRRRFTSNRKTSSVGYCAITATQDNTNIMCSPFEYIYYAINNTSNWVRGSTLIITTLNTGDTVYLKSSGDVSFSISGDKDVELSGNILSLVYGDNNSNETSLSHITYSIATFSNVVSVPSDFLPSKDLGKYCYMSMFSGCTSLVNAPELPATQLASKCYYSMFEGCTSLVNAPELPATQLASKCYYSMFEGCTSLTTAPELPALTLVDYCYERMFRNCTNLNYIKMLATDISALECLNRWVSGVASSGTFVKNPDATWDVTGTSGVPEGWVVKFDGEEEGGGGSEITFYLEDVVETFEMKAASGMTWEQWVNSNFAPTEGVLRDFRLFNMGAYDAIVLYNELAGSDIFVYNNYDIATNAKGTEQIENGKTYYVI